STKAMLLKRALRCTGAGDGASRWLLSAFCTSATPCLYLSSSTFALWRIAGVSYPALTMTAARGQCGTHGTIRRIGAVSWGALCADEMPGRRSVQRQAKHGLAPASRCGRATLAAHGLVTGGWVGGRV